MFSHQMRVRYSEVDQQGVVFNAHWLTYFDEAMTAYMEHLGFPVDTTWDGGPFEVQLVKAVIEWRSSAGFPDVLEIGVAPTRLGNSSFDLRFTARVADRVCAECVTTYVTVNAERTGSTPMPQVLRTALEAELDAD